MPKKPRAPKVNAAQLETAKLETTKRAIKPSPAPDELADPDEPTRAQREVLQGMHELQVELGRIPTMRELAGALGYADHTGVLKPLRHLARLGLVEYTPRQYIEGHFAVTAAGKRWL